MKNSLLFIILALAVLLADRPARAAAPDLILINGKVFTADPAHHFAEALAIRGERITAVGTTERISALAGPKTRRIELGGRVVVPGFNDAHFHHQLLPPALHLALKFPDPTWSEVLDALAKAVKQAPKGSWIEGEVGPTVANDPAATRLDLDTVAPEHPVFLQTWFGHVHVINSQAMKRLGVGDEEPDPLGGWFERLPGTRRVDGKIFEYAAWGLARRWCETASDEEIIKSMKALADEAAGFGITSLQNMPFLNPERYVKLLRQAHLPIRMRLIRWPTTDATRRNIREGRSLPRQPRGTTLVTVNGTKWLLDGTPLERGMAVRTPFLDRPGWTGRINFPRSEIDAMLRESLRNKDPVLFHAVGDRTIETVFNSMEAVDPPGGWPSRRVRLEHGDGLLADLVPRAKQLGVIVVQNPTHFDPAMNPVFDRFGTNQPYFLLRTLLEAGIPLALGSDGPLNPGLNLMFAVRHPIREALSREQAVEAYTRGSAYAEFAERDKGTLEVGKLADLAVLSQDIFTVPPDALPATKSVLTLVGGKIVHDGGISR